MQLPPTVEWKENSVAVINQTCLPRELKIIELTDVKEVADAINNMVVRGAPAIGVTAAMGLALAAIKCKKCSRREVMAKIQDAYTLLYHTRPTAVNLVWALDRIMKRINSMNGEGDTIAEAAVNEANSIAQEDLDINKHLGYFGSSLLKDNDTILTHCNAGALATVGYGTALGIIRSALEEGKSVKVIATETRPLLQGARLTCFELNFENIPVTLITDNMVGSVISRGFVDKVIVGADRVMASGHVINKIGTLTIALVAHAFQVPFYVAAPLSSFDCQTALDKVVIEERDSDEIRKLLNIQITPKNIPVYNPAFDITPPSYISGIITEKGVLKPPYKKAISSLVSLSYSS